MDLASLLKQFYGEFNVQSCGCIHHIHPANDQNGMPRGQVYLPEIISGLEGFAEINHLTLKNMEAGGANVYNNDVFIGTIIIHYF